MDHPSAPFTYQTPAREQTTTRPRINALLVALAALLHSYPGNVQDVLPHLSPDAPSSVCPSYMTQRLPQRKLMDTLASLLAFHPDSPTAAVALEATPDRVKLYISAATAPISPSPTASPHDRSPSPTHLELRADVDTWLGLVRDIAHARSPSPTNALPATTTGGADVMDLPDTKLTIAIFGACYPTLRMRLRALPLGVLLAKFENRVTAMAVFSLATLRPPNPHEDTLARLIEHLEMLLRLTEPGDMAEIEDARHFVALHVAGRFAARALRDEGFRVFLNRIDCETVEVVEQACLLSRLVTGLVSIAKSSSTEGLLALPWHIEWISPPLPASSFEAKIDLPVLQEWLAAMPWEESAFLDRLPDVTTWPYSEVVGELLRDVPDDLARTDGESEDGVRRYAYTLKDGSPGNMAWSQGHCEMALLRYLTHPENAVHAYPYIATSHSSCYACAMLARAIGMERGHEAEFVLRSCEARVDLPWIAGLEDRAAGGWGEDVVRVLEEDLLGNLRSLMVVRAEQLVELKEDGVLERIPALVGDLLRWR